MSLTAYTIVRVLPCLSQPAPPSVSYLVSHSLHHCPCLNYLVFQSLHQCPCLTVSLTACTTVRVLITLSFRTYTSVRVLPCLSQPAPLSVSYLVFQSLHHFSDSLVHGRHHATVGFAFFVSHVGAVVIFVMLGYFSRAVWSAVRQVHEERLARIDLVDDLD